MDEKKLRLYEICDPFKKKKVGRPRLFDAPQELWDVFVKYCKWVDDNPWQIKSASNSGGENPTVRQNIQVKQLPYTLYGFAAFASICQKWGDFRRIYREYSSEYLEVIDAIEQVCASQQVDGAMVREFDSNLVARLNGIADMQKVEVTGKEGTEFQLPKLSDRDFEELRKINDKL